MEQSSLVPLPRTVLAEVDRRPFGSFPEQVGHGPDVAARPVPPDDALLGGGRLEAGQLTAGLPPPPGTSPSWNVARLSPTPAS